MELKDKLFKRTHKILPNISNLKISTFYYPYNEKVFLQKHLLQKSFQNPIINDKLFVFLFDEHLA
jgi:hypothetical protein